MKLRVFITRGQLPIVHQRNAIADMQRAHLGYTNA